MGEMLNLDRIHHNGNPEITIGVDPQFKVALDIVTKIISIIDPTNESMLKIHKDNIPLENFLIPSGTIISKNINIAEIGEWSDGNVSSENRSGYFVSIDTSTTNPTIVKANSSSKVRGVIVESPAFATNASEDKFNTDNTLKKKYCYVAISGFVSVIDNGLCTVNGRCLPADDGTAIASTNDYGYLVVERIDETHIKILMDPQEDTIHAHSISDHLKISTEDDMITFTYR